MAENKDPFAAYQKPAEDPFAKYQKPAAPQTPKAPPISEQPASAGGVASVMGGQAMRAGTAFLQNINPMPLLRAVAHPLDTARGLFDQTSDAIGRSRTALGEGRYGDAAQAVVGSLPIVGPPAEQIVGDVRAGNIPEALGHGAGLLALGELPKMGRSVIANAPRAASAVRNFDVGSLNPLRVDPQVAVTRSLRPVPSDPAFPERIPQALSAIKATNPGFKPAVENGRLNLIPATGKAIAAHEAALEPWLQRMEGTRISGAPIIEATRRATQGMLPSESPSVESLMARARQDYGDFSPRQLKDRVELLNQRLSAFYNQAPGRQSAALADIPDAVLKAQRDAAANALYRHLDPENEGAGPRLIQARIGDQIDLRDAAMRRNNAIVAEQPMSPLGRFADPIKGFIRHVLPMPTGAGIAFAEGSEGRSLPMLRRAFNSIPSVEGANELGQLPRPGPRLLGPASDTSGPLPGIVRDARAVGAENPRAVRLLGPATREMGSGITAPDFSGIAIKGANRMNAGPRQLGPATEPFVGGTHIKIGDMPGLMRAAANRETAGPRLIEGPSPGQPPINILPRGPGAIGPAGTAALHSAETPIPSRGVLGGRLLDYLRRGARGPTE